MKYEPYDVPGVIIDLFDFCYDNPDKKLPMRYIMILDKILHMQLSGHPAVTGDDIDGILHIEAPRKLNKVMDIISDADNAETPTKPRVSNPYRVANKPGDGVDWWEEKIVTNTDTPTKP